MIAGLATTTRLPAIYDASEPAEAGVLMSYETDRFNFYRRAATYEDKILKCTKPADLLVEQPPNRARDQFEIAKQIGLTIPQHVLARADQVIR